MLFTVKSAKVWQWEFRMCSCGIKHHLIQNSSLCVCVHVSVWAFVVTVNVPVCIFALRVCVCARMPQYL